MKTRGFTLIELMVVGAIIALITSVILGSLGDAKAKSRDSERIQEMKTLQTALELYQLEFNYPAPSGGLAKGSSLTSAMQNIVAERFLSVIPTPPKGSSYPNEFYYYQTTDTAGNYSCLGKSLALGDIPYILYFSAERPQNLPKLINNSSLNLDQSVTNMYCLTI